MAGALDRILAKLDLGKAFDTLAERVSGSDLTTFLLALMHRRAARIDSAHLLARYGSDRFTGIAPIALADLRRVEDAAIAAARGYTPCVLSPVAPFALHSSLGTVDQNKVVTTVRGNEVAADPTNALALEAAVRRRTALAADPKSTQAIRLAAVQRVVRAQQLPPGPGYFAHFHIAGFVSAGRDTGSNAFELTALGEHTRIHADCAQRLGAKQVTIAFTDFTGGRFDGLLARTKAALERPGVTCTVDPQRASGRGYYQGLCFKSRARFAGEEFEMGDGGIVDWTQQLLGSAKERCFISGIGLDRLALANA